MGCLERGNSANIILLAYRIACCLITTGSTIYQAWDYFMINRYFCYLTIAALFTPALLTLGYNLYDYSKYGAPRYFSWWRILFNLFFPLNILPRYLDAFVYSYRYKNHSGYKDDSDEKHFLKREEDMIFWHGMWVSFMQSALILNLNMYAMASGTKSLSETMSYFKYFTSVISILSQGYALGQFRSYLHSLDANNAEQKNEETTYLSTGVLILSHSCEIGTRAMLYGICLSTPFGLLFLSAVVTCTVLVFVQVWLHLRISGTTFRYFAWDGKPREVFPGRKFFVLLFFTYVSIFSYVHNKGNLRILLILRVVCTLSGMILFCFSYSQGYVHLPQLRPENVFAVYFGLSILSQLLFVVFYLLRPQMNDLAKRIEYYFLMKLKPNASNENLLEIKIHPAENENNLSEERAEQIHTAAETKTMHRSRSPVSWPRKQKQSRRKNSPPTWPRTKQLIVQQRTPS